MKTKRKIFFKNLRINYFPSLKLKYQAKLGRNILKALAAFCNHSDLIRGHAAAAPDAYTQIVGRTSGPAYGAPQGSLRAAFFIALIEPQIAVRESRHKMNRTKTKTRPKPKPGGAKFNIAVDQELEKYAGGVSHALIREAMNGNPTCLHLLIRWSEDAEFAEECMTAYSSLLEQWIAEIRKEAEAAEAEDAAKKAEAEAAKTTTASKPKTNATTTIH